MQYEFSGFRLDIERFELSREAVALVLEPQVFDLLVLLVSNAGRLVTKDEMVERIWGGRAVSDSAISSAIAGVRRALGDSGAAQRIVRTVPKRGLQFIAPVTRSGEAPPPAATPPTRQSIRYATAPDGVRIAYALAGEGPMVLHLTYDLSHLELFWRSPVTRPLFIALTQGRQLLRHDPRGAGLSDRTTRGITDQCKVDDILAVMAAAGWTRGPILAEAGAGSEAVRLAVQHPDKVSALVIQGSFVHGRAVGGGGPGATETIEAMLREGWDRPANPFTEAFVAAYLPDMPPDERRALAAMFNQSCTGEVALIFRQLANMTDIAALLPRVAVPTLVVHSRHDAVHSLSEAQKFATGIPGAELVVLESRNALMVPWDPVWPEYLAEVTGFLDRHG